MKTIRLLFALLLSGSFVTTSAWADGYYPGKSATAKKAKSHKKSRKHPAKRAGGPKKIVGKSSASAGYRARYRYAAAWKKRHAKETLEQVGQPCKPVTVHDAIHRVGPLLLDDKVGELTTSTVMDLLQSLDEYRCLKGANTHHRLVPDIVPEPEPPEPPDS